MTKSRIATPSNWPSSPRHVAHATTRRRAAVAKFGGMPFSRLAGQTRQFGRAREPTQPNSPPIGGQLSHHARQMRFDAHAEACQGSVQNKITNNS